jgi:Cys-tRNA(Pro)/Cys-tRNA(Cys) deacylase
MTPAVKQCQKFNITFTLHHYQHDANAVSYGLEAAEKLVVPSERIFKTLVVETDKKQLAVAIVPVSLQLHFKSMAKSLACKKVSMADAKRVQNTTGYVLGGVSPLGQKQILPTIIDASSLSFDTIFISGGKRGLELEISHQDLAMLTKAAFATITC